MPRRKIAKEQSHVREIFVSRTRTKRTLMECLADWCTQSFGTSSFLLLNIIGFAAWIVLNTGWIPGFTLIDSYPFNFLTTAVSLEAIFLSIIVLMSQNRAAKVAEVREEMDLQINLQSEREVTKILEMLSAIERRLHVREKIDPELVEMLKRLDLDELEQHIVRALEKTKK